MNVIPWYIDIFLLYLSHIGDLFYQCSNLLNNGQNKTRRSGLVDPIEIGSECEARCSSTNSVMHS